MLSNGFALFFLVSGRFCEDENIQQLQAFFGLFSRKLSGPSLAKHLPFLLCISVIPPISMVYGIILRVPFLSTGIQPMNINLDKPLRIAKLYATYEDERCRWEWWNNHPSDLREHNLYRLSPISWNSWLNRDFHFMDTKPIQCLWQRIEFHPPKLAKWGQKKNTPPKNKNSKNPLLLCGFNQFPKYGSFPEKIGVCRGGKNSNTNLKENTTKN